MKKKLTPRELAAVQIAAGIVANAKYAGSAEHVAGLACEIVECIERDASQRRWPGSGPATDAPRSADSRE